MMCSKVSAISPSCKSSGQMADGTFKVPPLQAEGGRGEAGEEVHSIIQLSSCMHHVILSCSFITVCVPGHGGCGQLASAGVFI